MRKEYDFSNAKRGPVIPPDPRKTRITIRLDTEILNWFWQKVDDAGGGNYQTMINEALKRYVESEERKARRAQKKYERLEPPMTAEERG